MILCWAAFIAILGGRGPGGCVGQARWGSAPWPIILLRSAVAQPYLTPPGALQKLVPGSSAALERQL